MTTLLDRPVRGVSGRAMHAFVVGVGGYPYCGDAAKAGSVPAAIADVSTAEVTAREIAAWLLDSQRDDVELPLASLEVLISPVGTEPARIEVDGTGMEVGPAAYDPFRKALTHWHKRCDDPSATALFYFVGHGCSRSAWDESLLLSDFGAGPGNPFEGAVDAGQFIEGMGACAAGTQLFLLDCCREVPPRLLTTTGLNARVPLAPGIDPVLRTSLLVLNATAHGGPAFGTSRRATRFSQEVRQAFDGVASGQGSDGVWRVEAGLLATAVQTLRDRASASEGVRDRRPTASRSEVVSGLTLRRLDAPPLVPFTVGCSPPEAARDAELTLLGEADGTAVGPHSAGGPWHGRARAGSYELTARFPGGGWREVREPGRLVIPQWYVRNLPVERS
ncbi:caspase family protein [Streptomyces nojiriensis]|uniref:hypothetical protein n=1 Tax=Streptomyces nojiriensis TaxID=66374 RepID=UPI002E1984AD